MNSINHRIPASRKLSPPQTAIKCSVLRKWPIESMCVCVLHMAKQQIGCFFFCWSGWKIHVYGDKTNKYTVISAHFQQTGDPANLECHDILKGIVDSIFFSFHLCGGECSRYSRNVFRKNDFRIVLKRESASFAYLFLQLIL